MDPPKFFRENRAKVGKDTSVYNRPRRHG
jgi:hypothetical protein